MLVRYGLCLPVTQNTEPLAVGFKLTAVGECAAIFPSFFSFNLVFCSAIYYNNRIYLFCSVES